MAVAHWERVLAESPDLYVERDQIVRDLERLPLAACSDGGENRFFIDDRPLSDQLRVEAEDSDDEEEDDDDDDHDPDEDEIGAVARASPMRRSRTKTNGFYAVGRSLPKLQLSARVSNSSTDTKDR